MTLNGAMTVMLRFFAEFGSFTSKWLKIQSATKCSPKNVVFSVISFMAIFAEITEN